MIKKLSGYFDRYDPRLICIPTLKREKSRFKVFALCSDDIYVSWYDGKSDKAGTHVYCYSTVYTHTPLTTYPSPPPSNFTRKCESFREIWSLGGALGHAKYTLSEVKKYQTANDIDSTNRMRDVLKNCNLSGALGEGRREFKRWRTVGYQLQEAHPAYRLLEQEKEKESFRVFKKGRKSFQFELPLRLRGEFFYFYCLQLQNNDPPPPQQKI